MLYWDTLSVSNFTRLPFKIVRELTTIGNEDYVRTFLKAHESINMQKGYFHQLMYQSAVFYNVFYVAFGQAMQAAIAVKRVTGDPVRA